MVLVWDLALVLLGALQELSWRLRGAPQSLQDLLRVANEDGLITWTSVATMFAAGACCLVLGVQRARRGLIAAGAFFIYLSLDDGLQVHERLGDWVGESGFEVYNWVLFVMPVIALLGLLALFQLWHATGRDPLARRRVWLAYGMWGLALACEVIERPLRLTGMHWRGISLHRYSMVLEESLELLAPLVMLATLLRMLQAPMGATVVAARLREQQNTPQPAPEAVSRQAG